MTTANTHYTELLYKMASEDREKDMINLIDSNSDIDINGWNSRGMTPLHSSVIFGACECMKVLIKKGADVNIKRRNDKWSPLHSAIGTQHHACFPKCIIYLLENGAEVDAMDENKNTPLYIAVSSNNFNAVDLLIKYGADVTKVGGPFSMNPLQIAANRTPWPTCIMPLIRRPISYRVKQGVFN